ncbi:hypothetical protein M3175_04675 [Robertmurraya korlensis]|uniref:hypothetical protein n=1 Tax=Robertmurraya korlensis TaxID=519977 RepID=UPI00203ECB54|nr:hypothetical protein [Robertmurraya korlensis]MCM3600017.1 hypothetical protein [Robertmurraya korlensis]
MIGIRQKERVYLSLVYITITAWLTILFFALLPQKVNRVTNVIVFFVTSIVDINKLTLNISTFSLIKPIVTYSHWLALVVYRDITMSIILLIFVNVYFTTQAKRGKWGITILTFFLLLAGSQVLRAYNIIQYTGWTIYYEIICIAALIGITLLTARITTRLDGGKTI